jgi:hypothetical protein
MSLASPQAQQITCPAPLPGTCMTPKPSSTSPGKAASAPWISAAYDRLSEVIADHLHAVAAPQAGAESPF